MARSTLDGNSSLKETSRRDKPSLTIFLFFWEALILTESKYHYTLSSKSASQKNMVSKGTRASSETGVSIEQHKQKPMSFSCESLGEEFDNDLRTKSMPN